MNAESAPTMRRIHFVGSTPHASPEAAVDWMITQSGGNLWSVPDGETEPERGQWAQYTFDNLANLEEVRMVSPGDWSKNNPPRLQIRRGQMLTPERAAAALQYSVYAKHNYPVVQRVQKEHELHLPYQASIPSHNAPAGAFRLPLLPLPRHVDPLRRATALEINRIREDAGSNVIFQLELPLETVLLTKMAKRLPQRAVTLAAQYFAKDIATLIAETDEGTEFVIHLCEGRFNKKPGRALGHPETLEPIVLFANALEKYWPASRPLRRLHIPIAFGETPPPREHNYYRPLSQLALGSVRLIAGLAHPDQHFGGQLRARDLTEHYAGRQVDIAASCGLGQLSLRDANTVMEHSRELINAPARPIS